MNIDNIDNIECTTKPNIIDVVEIETIQKRTNYRVGAFRDAGLNAKWRKTEHGAPYIVVKLPHQNRWYVCNQSMWDYMAKVGVLQGYTDHTLLGDVFSVSR